MKYQIYYGLALLFASLILIFHEEISFFFQAPKTPNKELGRIAKSEGRSWRQNPSEGRPVELKAGSPLYHLDHVQTSPEARLEIAFHSGAKVLMYPDSRLILEQSYKIASLTVLQVLQGNVKELSAPDKGRLRIFSRGRMAESGTGSTASPDKSAEREQIRQTIRAQAPLFGKCYTNYLRKNPKSAGKLQVEFTILPNGQVEQAKVLSSTIKDEPLDSCVLQVMRGTRFRPFSGSAKKIIYPLSFGTH